MRRRFKALTGGLASSETDADIDALLQAAYQYSIPSELPGELTEGQDTIITVSGTSVYQYPDRVHSVRSEAPEIYGTVPIITNLNRHLSYETRPREFWAQHDRLGLDQGEPRSALFYGRQVFLRPVPDAVYWILFDTRRFKDALGATASIADQNHAMAVVTSAALEFCEDIDADELTAKLQRKYARYMDRLRSQSFTRSHVRREMRSF
jgi:hypothetical protein